MDRILLGNNAIGGTNDSKSGFWVSKPTINVVAYAGNGYYAGTEAGPEGLQEDGSVLPIYGYNENFDWTGNSNYTFGFAGRAEHLGGDAGIEYGGRGFIKSTSNGTLRVVANSMLTGDVKTGDPWFINVLNNHPSWTDITSYQAYLNRSDDAAFNGNNYPILEVRLRRPPKSDGSHWTQADGDNIAADLEIFYNTSNSSVHDSPLRSLGDDGEPFAQSQKLRPQLHWYQILGEEGKWTTLEYDFDQRQFRYQRDGEDLQIAPNPLVTGEWGTANTMIDAIRFDVHTQAHTQSDPDIEFDYVRAKKRGIPINFGNSLNDNFIFSSEWVDTGLVHRTGRVVLGNEYAWANGYSKDSGTSHPGSTSGRIEFPKLPYIPVVLFQRYDPSQGTKMSFPGGDKEFSFAHCDVSSNTQVWNPLTKQYQPSTNTAYGSEYRTFAYARAGYDHFDLTCRNAIARDGFEHLFNYTPQEPYVEIYKGGNYDPESENPESFVMYPKVSVNTSYLADDTNVLRSEATTFIEGGTAPDIFRLGMHNPLRDAPAIDNGLYAGYSQSPGSVSIASNFAASVSGVTEFDTTQKIIDHPPASQPHKLPPFPQMSDPSARYFEGYSGVVPAFNALYNADGLDTTLGGGFFSGLITFITFKQPTGDVGTPGSSFAVGKMHPNTLGLRRGKIITKDDLPIQQGFDQTINAAGGHFKSQFYVDEPYAVGSALENASNRLLGVDYNLSVDENSGKIRFLRDMKVLYNPDPSITPSGDSETIFTGADGVKKQLSVNPVNSSIYTAAGPIGSDQYNSSSEQLDWSAQDNAQGRLGYFVNYTGTDKGNCLPTFDWANKMGDWNVPQFNNFYQYDEDIGAGSYVSFKDAIGTSWNANTTKFLDDSMWLGYANNRFEYKGDIWHPQAPTKTYDELSGMFGYGGTVADQGDWHDFSGTHKSFEHGRKSSGEPATMSVGQHGFTGTASRYGGQLGYQDYKGHSGHGALGVHVVSRYDSNASFASTWYNKTNGPFAVDVHFRNRYMYRPFNGTHPFNTATKAHFMGSDPNELYSDTLAADYQPELGASGPGTQLTYGRLHDHGRTGVYSYTNLPYGATFPGDLNDNDNIFPNRQNQWDMAPPNIFWSDHSTQRLNNFSAPWIEADDITETSHISDLWTLGPGSEMRESASGGDRRFRRKRDRNRQDIHYASGIHPPDSTASGVSALGGKGSIGSGNLWRNEETGSLPSWTEPQTGRNAHKDSFVVSRWYTYPGATFSYDISNFSGPAHYDAWYKNDKTKEVNDYKRKDYPQLYTGGWGNYGYFPTQEQLDEGKGATRLFPTGIMEGTTTMVSFDPSGAEPYVRSPHGYGSVRSDWDWNTTLSTSGRLGSSLIEGPFVIFKKRALLKLTPNQYNPSGTPYDHYSGAVSVETATNRQPIYLYFVPNHMHPDKKISRTFGIPNDIAGDYYVASTVHNERGANPQVHTYGGDNVERDENDHVDPFHDSMGAFGPNGTAVNAKGWKWHTKFWNPNFNPTNASVPNLLDADIAHFRTGLGYYHPVLNPVMDTPDYRTEAEGGIAGDNFSINKTTYPDYKLNSYLLSKGIDVNELKPGDPIPIKADPYFAGMAFEGTSAITGAFNAHRFEFIIKKTKSHINHFRQSYEYNLPGRAGHRADTLRPIGYGLMSHITGFDNNFGPPPRAHSYFDSRQLGGGYPFWQDIMNTPNPYNVDIQNFVRESEAFKYVSDNTITGDFFRTHDDGRLFDVSHPAFSNSYWSHNGWGDITSEIRYDVDLTVDPTEFEKNISLYSFLFKQDPNKETLLSPETAFQERADAYETRWLQTMQGYDDVIAMQQEKAKLQVAMSRHGRDVMLNGIIGGVEVSNTYFADYKATYFDSTDNQLKYWITGTTTAPPPPTDNNYYNLQRPLRYRPAKSLGASPETQMYGAYLGAPWNRHVDYHKAWAGLNKHFISSGNHWEDDILPGMCKADNALTNWGTVDLSKFNEESYGYRWHNDAWYTNDKSGLAESIIWEPTKGGKRWSEATTINSKGRGADHNGSLVNRRTQNQKGGSYDGFKLHERPEFQPVSGDGRYFGGVGGVDNWGGTSYNTWGPGMSVSPTVWDLKWTSIQHPFGVSPSALEDANTFYGSTSIENQTSLIGGAPNVRVLIGDNGGTFKYSNGNQISGTGYDDANTWSATPQNYDWAIGGHQIQSNHWDRTLKIRDLGDFVVGRNTDDSLRSTSHANNGIQSTISLKVKACYRQDDTVAGGIFSGQGDSGKVQVWVLEYNGVVNTLDDLGWVGGTNGVNGDVIKLVNAPPEWDISDDGVKILAAATAGSGWNAGEGARISGLPSDDFGSIAVVTKPLVKSDGSLLPNNPETADNAPDLDPPGPPGLQAHPQLVAYNKTLAELPLSNARRSTNEFKANTTYHFQYMYKEEDINPPEYVYWVLRIPASMEAYNGESLI